MALTSPTSGGRSVGIFRWRTKALEFTGKLILYYGNPLATAKIIFLKNNVVAGEMSHRKWG
jgi:hypothetical protein